MLPTLVSSLGLATTAVISTVSGAARRDVDLATLRRVRETDERVKSDTKTILTNLSPSVSELDGVVSHLDRNARDLVQRRAASTAEIGVPLVDGIRGAAAAAASVQSKVQDARSRTASAHALLKRVNAGLARAEEDANRRVSTNNSDAARLSSGIQFSKMRSAHRFALANRDLMHMRERIDGTTRSNAISQ